MDYGGSDEDKQQHTQEEKKQPQEGKKRKEQPQEGKKAKEQPQEEKKQPHQGKKAKEQPMEEKKEQALAKKMPQPPKKPRGLFLLPRCLKGREFRVYTVGCKGEQSLEQELHDAGVSMKQSLVLDCRDFQGARHGVEWHWGTSTRVLVNILRADRDSLRIVFDQVAKDLTNRDINNLVFFCDHGKHRSVGVATLTSEAMKMACKGWQIHDVKPLMRKYWSRKKCPWIYCPECHQQNDTKLQCYKDALDMFTQQWLEHEGL